MSKRCLIITDDITGGADSGAQFANRGLSTLLISVKHVAADYAKYPKRDVLVINTDSRELSSSQAYIKISHLLVEDLGKEGFPVIYKKIDSTLRGNLGYEIDAILDGTDLSVGFLAPSFPEQNRTVVGGILMINGNPLSLSETTHNDTNKKESHVYEVLKQQSRNKIGKIDLTCVAAGSDRLMKAIDSEIKKGAKILIFDAVMSRDLANIAEAGFRMNKIPLFIGSAGLAKEVATKLFPLKSEIDRIPKTFLDKRCKRIFIICGSLSIVSQKQIESLEKSTTVKTFELSQSVLRRKNYKQNKEIDALSSLISKSLVKSHVVLRTHKNIFGDYDIGHQIRQTLGHLTQLVLEKQVGDVEELALIITGGATASSVFDCLGIEGFEIGGEILDGVVFGRLIGGVWNNLNIITKAGAFGQEDTLERIINAIECSTADKELKI